MIEKLARPFTVPKLSGFSEKLFVYVDYATASDGVSKAFYVGKGTKARVENVQKVRNSIHTQIANSSVLGWYRVVVNSTNDETEVCCLERQLIRLLKTRDYNGGSNRTDGGDGSKGAHVTKETRAKLAARPFAKSPEFRALSSARFKGVPKSVEQRAKMSAASIGRPKSPEAVAKMTASLTGKHLSDDHRASLSASTKGRPKSPSHSAKISSALKGKPKSDTHRAALCTTPRTLGPDGTVYKTCLQCEVPKSLEDFHKNKNRWDGRELLCKLCRNAKARSATPHMEM